MRPTEVKTGQVRFSYAYVFEPRASEDGGKPKYSVSILVPKKDKETVKALRAGIEAAYEEKKSIFGGKTLKAIKTPLRDGDEERPDDEAYADHYFFNASSIRKIQVVNRQGEPLDEDTFFSGCYGKALINFYAFEAKTSKGIAAGLQAILKTKGDEDDALGGSAVSATTAFAEDMEEGSSEEGDDW